MAKQILSSKYWVFLLCKKIEWFSYLTFPLSNFISIWIFVHKLFYHCLSNFSIKIFILLYEISSFHNSKTIFFVRNFKGFFFMSYLSNYFTFIIFYNPEWYLDLFKSIKHDSHCLWTILSISLIFLNVCL